MDATVLVVRHGPGRGRNPEFLAAPLAHLARTAPELYRRVRLHATGEPLPSLAGVAVVWFALADPLRELYPACFAEAEAIATVARRRGLRLINPPHALSNSIKSVQATLWRGAGLPTPEVVRFNDRDSLLVGVERIGYPFVIRANDLHTQQGMRMCGTPADLDDLLSGPLPCPGALSPLVDVRSGFTGRLNPYRRWFHKKRMLVLGHRLRSKHVFFADKPIVTARSCIHNRIGGKLAWMRWSPTYRASVRADLDYWRRGDEHGALLLRALHTLGLHVAAIDYSCLGDGGLVLWEANPYPYLPLLKDMMLPRWRRAEERIASYHDAIGTFLADLLAP